TSDGAVVRMQAENMLHEPNLVHLKGKVEIRTYWSGQPAERCVVLRADEAVYHVDTGEIEPQGNVSVRPAVER
ncbi:MAG TPA: hypothetical protein VGS58_16475, partial [Candidatus Sulfopaludibacter sp.]|nr:hypothetical protein [Candidatus Sulfopaludibacter sp.]